MKTAQRESISKETKIELLRHMLHARVGDLREQRMIRQGKGLFHVSGMGHEALAAVGMQMEREDYGFPFYRDRGFAVGRGISTYDLAMAFYAKRDSMSGGKQLPAHYNDRELNIWAHLSPIAAHLLPACGAAWGLQMDGKDNVVYASVGDGGTRQGDFYEAVCFARERSLPMVFVVEDNGVAISTRTEKMHAQSIGGLPAQEEWVEVDGSDPLAVYLAYKEAAEYARSGKGPRFIWCKVERLSSHSSADDHRNYRSEEELEEITGRDPVKVYKEQLIEEGVMSAEEVEALEAEIEAEVKADYAKADKEADPKAGDELTEIFGEFGVGNAPKYLESGKEYRMADAVNLAFKDALEGNADTVFFGEDIEDPLGGVFKLTKGLSTEYPGRVVNSPLAESTIIGVAAGLASYGKRPIFEIQFIDFISPGWNQVVNNLGNLRWRSHGQWKCPAIIYAPSGAYLPGGALWHSQSSESLFAHTPGLIVVMPSTPEDAAGLLSTCLACEDPVLFLIPKHMLWATKKMPAALEAIPLGKAKTRQKGTDLTIVSWGNCLEIVEEALAKYGNKASVELIDLRSIVPWDREAVLKSAAKTGRMVIVQEDNENCSVGQMIVTEVMGDHETWGKMVAPPVLLSRGNMQMAYNPIMEYSCLPDVDGVMRAMDKVMAISKKRELTESQQVPMNTESTMQHQGGHGHGMEPPVVGGKKTIVLPNLGEGLRDARVVEIFKAEGEMISADDSLCEVETDKAVFPVEASFEGKITKWLVAQEDLIQVGQAIVEVEVEGGVVESAPVESAADEGAITQKGALSGEILRQMEGVLPANLSVNTSWKTLREVRGKTRGRSSGGAFSYTTMVAFAVVKALEEFPAFRRLLKNGGISEPLEDFDIGFAVAMENDELETAVIPKANTLNWGEFVGAYREALKKVREGIPQSKARATLLLTSMGPLKIRNGNPIVVPPAVATLFLGEPHFEAMEGEEGEVKMEEVAALDFSFDHRWANGAGAGRFLKRVKDIIEGFDAVDLSG